MVGVLFRKGFFIYYSFFKGLFIRIVVIIRVLLVRVCDRLMFRVVVFMVRVRLEYYISIWGREGVISVGFV